MFLSFFGFREQPFGTTPDPKYLYWSRSHREALATLYYGIKTERGFIALIAPPGFGKTTLAFQLLENLRPDYQTAFLFQTRYGPGELLRFLLADLGYRTDTHDLAELHLKVNEILTGFAQTGKQLVLVIDEAQNLTPATLETLRLLSNFERPDHKIIQILLSGQSQLEEKLKRSNLAQFRQRISAAARLSPLNPAEIREYIEHRLCISGYRGPFLFRSGALEQLTEASEGIPRLINCLCFNSLSLACARQAKRVDASMMQETISDMRLSLPFPHHRSADALSPEEPVASKPILSERQPVFASEKQACGEALRTNLEETGTDCSFDRLRINLFCAKPRLLRHPYRAGIGLAMALALVSAGYFLFEPKTAPQPVPVAVSATASSPAPDFSVTVQKGEALGSIAKKYLGRRLDPNLLKEILVLNPQIVTPDEIWEGQELRLPLRQGESTSALSIPVSGSGVYLQKQAQPGSKQ